MLHIRPETRSKLDHSARLLRSEFTEIPHETVLEEIEIVTNELLAEARFDDYIPILVHRYVREHLFRRLQESEAAWN